MLAAEHATDEAVTALRRRWEDAGGSLRVDGALDPEEAATAADELRRQPFALQSGGTGGLEFQYRMFALQPDDDCAHPLCRLARWLRGGAVAWASAVSGVALAGLTDDRLVCAWYAKGCYLDPHNDYDGARKLAFVIGLTRDPGEVDDGGHLEFLDVGARGVRVAERRAPGFNTLDLFDVRAPDRLHRVPLVRRDYGRLTIFGWFG